MRFRKSVSIAKGLRLNFSKSGLSLTGGARGASITMGKRGTYLNSGIPGTGLYDRQKISGSKRNTISPGSQKQSIELSVSVGIDDSGNIYIKDSDGSPITNEQLIRTIKKSADYKLAVEKLVLEKKSEIDAKTNPFTDVLKQAPKLLLKEEVQEQLKQLKQEEYLKEEFRTPRPDEISTRQLLYKEAKTKIWSLAFWTLKQKWNAYVEENLQNTLERCVSNWIEEKTIFEAHEKDKKSKLDVQYHDDYVNRKTELESYLAGDTKYVESKIDEFLHSVELPIEFTLDYEYSQKEGCLLVDLDLPEIDDLPSEKANILSTGKLKIKKKTKQELNEEYVRCVLGLAFVFSASLFNVSTHISKILISGYTQRINKKTGNTEDEYVYSIIFEREIFGNLTLENIDAFSAFLNFQHVINRTETNELRTIIPLDKNSLQ